MGWQQEAHKHLIEGNYAQVVQCYEQAIKDEPSVISNYWYLGLSYLLHQQEELAQTTWFFAIAQVSDLEITQWTQHLVTILETEAQRQISIQMIESSWLIRQHIREIEPENIDNILNLVLISFELKTFDVLLLEEYRIIDLINNIQSDKINSILLLKVLTKVLDVPSPSTLRFLSESLKHAKPINQWVVSLTESAIKLAEQMGQVDFAIQVIKTYLPLDPDNSSVLQYLCLFYDKFGNYLESFEAAKNIFEKCPSNAEKLLGSYLMAEAFIQTNGWINSSLYIEKYKDLMRNFIKENSNSIEQDIKFSLVIIPQLLAYVQDNPCENNWFQNKIANLFQNNLKLVISPSCSLISSERSKPLKIGYIAHTFRVHSVGWLSRWLFHHHRREIFQTAIYFVNQDADNEFSKNWFKDKASFYRDLKTHPQEVAAQIQLDEIDILIDLDSVTSNGTCIVMALKPAPIQITWLGKDASGISSIDYFMADPYVLPANAQDYYQETIWRLPQTYIAVDGFEIDVPTLRRDDLGIPSDAIVYFTAQNGLKRHPETVRLQMQIIKEVRNGHLLVKGRSNEAAVQQLFIQLAEEEGLNPDRLHFLPMDPNEYVHRANLQIADVILDTFPYNGATTTLEALWVGIPLVTKVGQQFAARNSYAFLMNVGVTEGIAWTNEEYVGWGIRLGRDEALRQQVAWKLKRSRQTSPLWNAKQFTRDMEDAYQQMWTRYTSAV
jgi:predicted O-linked N-acetylglucosamine transferase (SPINDLY family)